MNIYTQSEIDNLIKCQKIIIEPPPQNMRVERGHLKKDMKLQSVDSKHKFSAFMRINERFNENFSIGLIYIPMDDTPNLTLIRFNGPHGEYIHDLIDPHPHFGYHIYKVTEKTIQDGTTSEKFIELTEEYSTFDDAIRYFIRYTNIIDAHKYFEKHIQLPLFKEDSDELD